MACAACGDAGLEALRRGGVGRRLHPHGLDHRAAGEERRHGVRAARCDPTARRRRSGRASCGRRTPRSRRPSVGDVEREVRRRLAGVEHRQRADRAGRGGEPATGLTVPSTLETWVNANDLGALGEQPPVEPAASRSSRPSSVTPTQRSVAPVRRGQLLPRHEVGVVLHLGDEDLVARPEVEPRVLGLAGDRVGERVGHEVERLGGVLGEHHLVVGAPPTNARDLARAPS